MPKTPLYTRAQAVEYVWKKSKPIRDWYLNEHHFDLKNHSRSEYNTFGLDSIGDTISNIIDDGIKDGLIVEDLGDYRAI